MPQERHDFAVRFTPSTGGAHVAAVAYIKSLEAVLDGLSALRAALAPSIGVARGWSAADVKDALIFSVGPTTKGSLIVPLVPGAHMRGPHLDVDAIAVTFWERASAELSKVRTRKATYLSANAADAFARASAAAKDGEAKVSLAMRRSHARTWRSTADLTRLERPLRTHAERRRAGHQAIVCVTGQIVSLTFDPPSFVLATAHGKQTIQMPAGLRSVAQGLWGEEVLVDLDAAISTEGDIGQGRALAIRPAGSAERAAADFDQTFGSLRHIWGTEDAQKYVGTLRSRRAD